LDEVLSDENTKSLLKEEYGSDYDTDSEHSEELEEDDNEEERNHSSSGDDTPEEVCKRFYLNALHPMLKGQINIRVSLRTCLRTLQSV
jgi:hypothetical protein